MKDKRINENNILDSSSITFKLWMYFICFAVCIFIILWCMQVVFIQTFYSNMKKHEVNRLVNTVSEKYKNGVIDEIDKLSYKNNISILIIDKKGNQIYNSNLNHIFEGNMMIRINSIPVDRILEKLQENDETSFTIKLEKIKGEVYMCAKKLADTEYYVVVSSSIDPIDATANVLRYQLTYIIIIALILSSIVSIFISKRIAKPIIEVNEKAKQLAKGNYNIEFTKAGYKEIDNLADTLNYATKELEKTDNLRKELIANVSHDLKTPLTMIKAYSEMIKDLYVNDEDKVKENLNVIINETDRLTVLVNDMLDLSKLESNRILLNIEEINLLEISKRVVNNFMLVPENKDFNIQIESDENIIINADKSKIEQVIYNLLGNAINYSENNKNIIIKIEKIENKIKYSVIDNGKGISEEDIKYIWDRYYKADKNYERASKGTGLGLSIVKNILELHNANYGVESKLGEGSTFWFEINK